MMSPATRSECKINFARPKTLVEIKIVYIVPTYLYIETHGHDEQIHAHLPSLSGGLKSIS